jgi:hypothetical protein
MSDRTSKFDKRNTKVRWELIERLHRSYTVGVADHDRDHWFEEYHSLSADERELLEWKMDEGDSALTLLVKEMKQQGAKSPSELRDDDDEPPTAV